MQTVRNEHDEQRDVARFGWSAGSTGRSGMNGRNGRNGMVVEISALLSMIGSNSWGCGELPSGRIALALLLAALVSAAFLKGEPTGLVRRPMCRSRRYAAFAPGGTRACCS
ncbi:hypothetical protein OEJ37_34285 [Burkholderia sp. BKH01]|nr:hypothetical protein [Burkholderia sp. BKH01]